MATHTEGPGRSGAHRVPTSSTRTAPPTSGVPSSSPTPATGRCRSVPTFTCPLVNAALDFDRDAAAGFRLDVPSGTSQRFEPGASRSVAIVALRGRRVVPGIQVRADG